MEKAGRHAPTSVSECKEAFTHLLAVSNSHTKQVRNHVADVLYTRTQSMSLCEANWSVSPRELRGRIDDLTKE